MELILEQAELLVLMELLEQAEQAEQAVLMAQAEQAVLMAQAELLDWMELILVLRVLLVQVVHRELRV
jgi:hypothetical protein